jgi:hypothetical protein
MTAWSRSLRPDAARRAERILDTMMLLYDLTKSEKVKPNHHHFVAGTSAFGIIISVVIVQENSSTHNPLFANLI